MAERWEWWDNSVKPPRWVIVDLGQWRDAATRRRYSRLSAELGTPNFRRVGNDRLIVRIPPKRVDAILRDFPRIRAGAAEYCWCTHGWLSPAQGGGGKA